jgi:ATP-dependent helicase/nuclease subunit A
MSRKANAEQLLAIEHNGGVLLSAGAGSGKTFVLVEHFVHRIRNQRSKLGSNFSEKEMRNFLSGQVYITFTRKAAGELRERIEKRIEMEISTSESESKFWEIIRDSLDLPYIGTIHGFCYSLIQSGLFAETITAKKIADETLRNLRVESSLYEFLNTQDFIKDKYLLKYFSANRKSLYETLKMVMGDPELRNHWEVFDVEEYYKRDHDQNAIYYFNRIMDLLDLGYLFRAENWNLEAPNTEAKWFDYYQKWQGILRDGVEWLKIDEFVKQRSPTPRNLDQEDPIKIFFNAVSEFKDAWRKIAKSIFESENIAIKSKDTLAALKNIFDQLNSKIHSEDSLTFSDIEYYTLKSLQVNSSVERIHSNIDYIVIDEFQDTSNIQFEIIKILIGGDFNKLFCVGDVKQAIYGFRGGTLTVFEECEGLVPIKLDLLRNYRSKDSIVNFNNSLFSFLFSLGLNYEAVRSHNVKVTRQEPFQVSSIGDGVYSYRYNVGLQEEKPSSEQLMEWESEMIYKIISDEQVKEGTSEICVLYKNLKPSRFLIYRLIESPLVFKTQIKINGEENPIYFLSKSLFEFLYAQLYSNVRNQAKAKKFCLFVFTEAARIFGNSIDLTYFELELNHFVSNVKLYGKKTALIIFYRKIGFASIQLSDLLALITSTEEDQGDSLESFLETLEKFASNSVSYELKFGTGRPLVRIMSAHASKGLEFEKVILAGLHNNGRTNRGDDSFIGQDPGSIKIRLDITDKDSVSSLEYIYEKEMKQRKDFAESNRLFYVACTRAISKLIWVDLHSESDGGLLIQKDAWINGLRKWQQNVETTQLLNIIDANDYFKNSMKSDVVKIDIPIMFKSNLGIMIDESAPTVKSSILSIPEISVTRLIAVNKCPRLFYLKNICKLNAEDLLPGAKVSVAEGPEKNRNYEEIESIKKSSAERGILYHEIAEKMVKGNLVPPLSLLGQSNYKNFEWLGKELLKKKEHFEFSSEVEIKFSISGFMMSGIPDLILYPLVETNPIEVWDFKTGKSSEEKNAGYYEQLIYYAYAAYKSKNNYQSNIVDLILCYIDEMKLFKISMKLHDIDIFVSETWKKLSKMYEINPNYCPKCEFNSICNFK